MARITFHFDLNRTILMSDVAGGRSVENTINYLLAEVAWGISDGLNWRCVHQEPTPEKPTSAAAIHEKDKGKLITYKAHVDKVYPYKNSVSAQESGRGCATKDELKKFNKMQKAFRKDLQSSFTDEGSAGASFRSFLHSTIDSLNLPGQNVDVAKKVAESLPEGRVRESFASGRVHLLPSFMDLLFYLDEKRNKHGLDISIVFRSFGEDVNEVATEIELLTRGTHPLYPGTKLSEHFALRPPYGVFYRGGFGSDGALLALGTLDKVSGPQASNVECAKEFYSDRKGVRVVHGFRDIAASIDDELQGRGAFALRDYWEWWMTHGEHAEYGKLLLVDPDATEFRTVFFDDHIEEHDAHIVDVRNVHSGAALPWDSAKEFLIRAEPYLAITKRSYFIDLCESLLKSWGKL